MNPDLDTIAAVATAPGRGGIGVVRVSGPSVTTIARGILGQVPGARQAALRSFRAASGESVDRGIAVLMPGPGSYTGEDVLELHGHGGPAVLDAVLARVLELGARPARPGEFTERAFLNGRLDLAQAEAVADLVDAGTESAARAALRSLDGVLSREVHALADGVAELRAWVEAAIDFPDDDVDELADAALGARLAGEIDALETLRGRVRHGVLVRDGVSVVIAGRPNVGKSSLLNRLCGRDAAIVTEVPGTTRDPVRVAAAVSGTTVEFVDTAGLRESADVVERIGVERTWEALDRADALLIVCDDVDGPGPWEQRIRERAPGGLPAVLVRNKIDLRGGAPARGEWQGLASVSVSARDGGGAELLLDTLRDALGAVPAAGGEFSARRRHLEALDAAAIALARAGERVAEGSGDLAAEDLRSAERALGEIVGASGTEDLLERIFSSFCIGK